ncbi:cellulose synthase family protein [Sediminitomix flava]|uniref:cellulose synthase family protein n=1 Tax=Sediminitomix flava TaxID=379075 RepID=UPI002936D75C|nr:glycosyltransferase [Sediminitomix flava]
MAHKYLKSKDNQVDFSKQANQELPNVTVQLPVYNEKYVVERLIDCICKLDYPKEKLEIQVLDDSTDETVEIIANKVSFWKNEGIDIQHIQREIRTGFKAGALDYGLKICKGQFIAIFDADFLPESDFLQQTINAFQEDIGVVQTRWGHVNQDFSFLTKLQAFGLDAHFTVEQGGRNSAGSFINFNGTAGVWRKQAIEDGGGWQADTLTEDLDLSYRTQMSGWKFKFVESVVSPAELPVYMPSVKSQQFRWNKGGAECARKHLSSLWKQSLPFQTKFHATFHLLNSSIFISLLVAALVSVPLLILKTENEILKALFHISSVFFIGFMSVGYFYYLSAKRLKGKGAKKYFFKRFPVFLIVVMGLSLHNALAVLEGLLGFKSPFIRTPKFGVDAKEKNWQSNKYIRYEISWLTIGEGILACYFLIATFLGIYYNDYSLLLLHLMMTVGFFTVFFNSIKPIPKS